MELLLLLGLVVLEDLLEGNRLSSSRSFHLGFQLQFDRQLASEAQSLRIQLECQISLCYSVEGEEIQSFLSLLLVSLFGGLWLLQRRCLIHRWPGLRNHLRLLVDLHRHRLHWSRLHDWLLFNRCCAAIEGLALYLHVAEIVLRERSCLTDLGWVWLHLRCNRLCHIRVKELWSLNICHVG